MFNGEVVYCEWRCIDDETNETIAKGNANWYRRGHRGACYLKCEQLTFIAMFMHPMNCCIGSGVNRKCTVARQQRSLKILKTLTISNRKKLKTQFSRLKQKDEL